VIKKSLGGNFNRFGVLFAAKFSLDLNEAVSNYQGFETKGFFNILGCDSVNFYFAIRCRL
jgi:hypothetical protein